MASSKRTTAAANGRNDERSASLTTAGESHYGDATAGAALTRASHAGNSRSGCCSTNSASASAADRSFTARCSRRCGATRLFRGVQTMLIWLGRHALYFSLRTWPLPMMLGKVGTTEFVTGRRHAAESTIWSDLLDTMKQHAIGGCKTA
jgi:hypothetical protein